MPIVHHILIIVKTGHTEAARDAKRLAELLEQNGISVDCVQDKRAEAIAHFVESARLNASTSSDNGGYSVVVLGGDGTFIGVSRQILTYGGGSCPILGMNYGKVGFLAEMPYGSIDSVANMLTKGTFSLRRRMALHWSIQRQGLGIAQGYAVNDLFLSRNTGLARVCSFSVSVDGVSLGYVRADGIVLSAPSGTSGYAYSAGGSLVHPDIQALSVTTVSPFLSHFPNMVLPPQSNIEIGVDSNSSDAFLTIDGQDGVDICSGDTVSIYGIPNALTVVMPEKSSYFHRLCQCGFISQSTS